MSQIASFDKTAVLASNNKNPNTPIQLASVMDVAIDSGVYHFPIVALRASMQANLALAGGASLLLVTLASGGVVHLKEFVLASSGSGQWTIHDGTTDLYTFYHLNGTITRFSFNNFLWTIDIDTGTLQLRNDNGAVRNCSCAIFGWGQQAGGSFEEIP